MKCSNCSSNLSRGWKEAPGSLVFVVCSTRIVELSVVGVLVVGHYTFDLSSGGDSTS